MKDRCSKKPNQLTEAEIELVDTKTTTTEKTITTQTRKIIIKLKNNNQLEGKEIQNEQLKINHQNDNNPEVNLILKELRESNRINQEMQKSQREEISLLKKEIEELKKKPTTINVQNNTLIQNNNILCFNPTIDLYMKKKDRLGDQKAFEWLSSMIKSSNPDNKFNWIKDNDIIDQSKQTYPFELKSTQGKKFVISVRVKPDQIINDDGTHINQIGNDIVSNSVITAIKEVTDPIYIDDMFAEQDENRFDDYFVTPIYQKMGKTIYDDLLKYRKIQPKQSHLKEIAQSTISNQ